MKIAVYIEHQAGALRPISGELLAQAQALAGGDPVEAVLIGADGLAGELGALGADAVLTVSDDRLADGSPAAHARALAEVAKTRGAGLVLLGATALGRDLVGRVAAHLETAAIADCTEMRADGSFVRPMYSGKAFATVTSSAPVTVASLRPKAFGGSAEARAGATEAVSVSFEDADFAASYEAPELVASDRPELTAADVVVAMGRGIKGSCDPTDLDGIAANAKHVEDLADALGGAVGSSRAIVDAGWRPHDEQVGQTGKTVSPGLYIAVGVSGAIQHLAGMRSSKYIIAINKDADAPIFGVSDLGVVGDLFELVPALTEAIQAAKG